MADGDGTGAEFLYKWTKVSTEAFIKARAEEETLFTGEKNSAMSGWRTVLQKIGLEGKVAPQQARKKWDNLKKKYKELKCPPTGSGTENGEATAASWPWFTIMDEALGRRHSIVPPVLVASMHDGEPCSSPAVAPPEAGKAGRKRSVLELLEEDMRKEEEREEKRMKAAEERAERYFSLFEKLIDKIK
ncbi:hypothetical protein AMEX_G19879 [Astyanax mexicanus]|uniref:Myb/SANT-like DNA-binding domain-containing protein n=1 Tax=Astyanax mexicanus TaxID=7994 RepID=A0A8T2LE68_ASTMX|nr:hypothetical protein AMEX_G19879 [Astyanax mexicanus]